MSESEDDRGGSDVSGDDDDVIGGQSGFDLNAVLDNMTEAERKNWDKNARSWRVYIDFLFRHVAIVTFKYNCFEREDLLGFQMALEKAEDLREKTKTKKGDTARIACLRDMQTAADLLTKSRCPAEATRLRRYLDLVGRMRGLAAIAGGFCGALKRGKAAHFDRIKRCVDFWKGFCLRSFDFGQLALQNVDESGLSGLERRYLAWTAVVRTSLNLAGKFFRRVGESTGLKMLSDDPVTMRRHMQAAEYVLATKMEQLLTDRVQGEANTADLLQEIGSLGLSSKDEAWNIPSLEDVDPSLLRPIPDTGILLEIPLDPPKEKKLTKKKGKGKRTNRSVSAGSHKGRQKKR